MTNEINYYDHPYISASMMKKALKSPSWLDLVQEETEALTMGKLLHEKFFNGKPQIILCPEPRRNLKIKPEDVKNFDSEFAEEKYFDKGIRLGLPVILESAVEKLLQIIDNGHKHLKEINFNLNAFNWIEKEFYDDVRGLKAKIDAIFIDEEGNRVLVDLKSTNLSLENSSSCVFEALKYCYDVQMAHYVDVINNISDEKIDKVELWFLSKTKNNKLVRIKLDKNFLETGLKLRDFALTLFSKKDDIRYKITSIGTDNLCLNSDDRIAFYKKLHEDKVEEFEDENPRIGIEDPIDSWARIIANEIFGEIV